MVGYTPDMLNTIHFAKSCKLFCYNCGPLSETSCLGKQCAANSWRNSAIVCAAVVDDIGMTSGHLDCASTMIKNIFPWKGPAKSK